MNIMKRNQTFFKVALLTGMLLCLTACPEDTLPNGQSEESLQESRGKGQALWNGFAAQAAESAEFSEAKKAKKLGQKTRYYGGMWRTIFKDLNLSEAQKSQFKALYSEGPQVKSEMKAVHERIQQAFVSETFDAAALQQELQAQFKGQHARHMAENILKAWQILTPEQRSQLESQLEHLDHKRKERMARRSEQAHNVPRPKQTQHMSRWLEPLALTDAQKEQLKALWVQKQSMHQADIQQRPLISQSILNALKSGTATADSLAALMPIASMHPSMLSLDQMAKLHQILTPTQRQKMLEMMQQGGRGKARRQGAQQDPL